MSFNPELIKVSKSNDKYSNLVHGKDSITFGLRECYSHFGLTFNKKFRNYSIGINIKDKLFDRPKAVEEKAKEYLDRPLSKLQTTFAVPCRERRIQDVVFKVKTRPIRRGYVRRRICCGFWFNYGVAIYKGCEHPSLLVRVDEIDIKKAPPREKPAVKAFCDEDD